MLSVENSFEQASTSSTDSTSFDEDKPTPVSRFTNLSVLKKIGDGKFPVYLTESPIDHKLYAMKLFPHKNNQLNPFFLNEIRFSNLHHPNIITPIYHEIGNESLLNNSTHRISFTLMEFAPHRDFLDALTILKIKFDDILLRTYFHQLIAGVEFLHSNGISHRDLKLENLMLGENFELKIIDFDLACFNSDPVFQIKGTPFYQAPEVASKTCKNPQSADIYSIGIILFILESGGVMPHFEDKLYEGISLYALLQDNVDEFWRKHAQIQKRSLDSWNPDFQELFVWMTREDAEKRPTLSQIKESKWYNGVIYEQEELVNILKKSFKK